MHLALAVFAAALGGGAPQADDLTLRWSAPAGCPGAMDVRAAFERHAKPGHAAIDVEGTVTEQGARFVLELVLEGRSGRQTRRIEAETCDALAETAGLLSAVASEPAGEPAVVPEPQPLPELDPPPEPDPESVPSPAPAPQRSIAVQPDHEPQPTPSPVRLIVRADGVVQALRLLPRIVGAGVRGAVGVAGERWRAELRGQYFAPQPRNYADLVVGGSFDLWTLAAAGCYAPQRGRLTFPLCGGVEVGRLRGRTQDVEQPGDGGDTFAGAIADAALVFAPAPRVGLRAGLGGVVSLRRPLFHVRGRDTLFEAGPGALRASLGVEVRFL